MALSSDGTTVLSAGDSRLELWRSDMVRMLSYGALDARIKPGTPASPLCRLVSAAASSSAVSVLEACPNQADLRLTLLRPAKEEDTPDLKYVPQPGVSEDSGARVVAVSDTTTAVYVPTPEADGQGHRRDRRDDRQHAAAQAAVTGRDDVPRRRPDHVVDRRHRDGVLRQRTSATATRSAASGSNVPLGPATMMAGRLLVPVTDGYDVYDPASGQRAPHSACNGRRVRAVVPAVAGSTLLEQRGDELVALGQPRC